MISRLAGGAGRVVVALAWVGFVIGSSVFALTIPVYTSAAVQALGVPASAGLSVPDAVRLSGDVRAFVADPETDPLPAIWRGRPAFDAGAVGHLSDVRAVLSGARIATAAAAALLAAWIGAGIARKRWDRLTRGMRDGAVAVFAVVAVGGAVALLDFESFFAAFHGLFFAPGTWRFPYDSMLIQLFPERFWVTSGIAWGALCAALGGGLLVAAAYVSRASRPPNHEDTDPKRLREGGSRMAEDVYTHWERTPRAPRGNVSAGRADRDIARTAHDEEVKR